MEYRFDARGCIFYAGSDEPGRQPRPPVSTPNPADDGGPRGIEVYDKLKQDSKGIIERMRQTDPKRAERYRQRSGE
ncbi:MAG: ubiquitin-like protein UBact [Candidatus Aenigmarchaeota archaeon]|nr:ubiquitin-like protein UBact [Candidatus Aenigmarchaeota archaeon]